MEGDSTWGSWGFPGGGRGGRAPPECGVRKFSILLLKIDHSETSEFMILGKKKKKNSQEEAVNKFYVSSFFPLAQALPWHLGF